MKIEIKLCDVKAFTIFRNEALTFGPNGNIKANGLDLLPIVNNNQCLFWKNDIENVSYLNGSLDEIILEEFSGGYSFKTGFLVTKRSTKKYFYLKNGELKELGDYLPFSKPLFGDYFIKMQKNTEIGVYEYPNLLWQVDISQYGERRLDRHGKEIDSNTHNNVSGELMGYEDTLVVPLAGGQLLGLNIQDGSFKWMLERGANRLLAHSNKYLYSYYWGAISEIDIQTGESLRTLDLSSFLKGIKDGLFYSNITNGKLIFDFSSDYSNLLIIDIEKLEIESYIENPHRSMMLRVGQGNCIYHENKLYARDPMSNTLYIFEEEHITQ